MPDALERLRRRAERERSARLQAEFIAERAIADLTQANHDLDAKVAARTADLEAALKHLAVLDEVKSNFLRGVAHEMSTPLHTVRGLLELMERADVLDSVRQSARQAGRAAERLHAALRTLVEFAAVSSGQVSSTAESFELGDYADAVVDRNRLSAARRGLLLMAEVSPEPDRSVSFDPVRLDQVVDALVDNAIRFGRTRVDLIVAFREGLLEVVVADDGPGPARDLGETIFESFVRGDRSDEGFGVGLTLARLIAEALGGTLELRPTAESPARFVATFPC